MDPTRARYRPVREMTHARAAGWPPGPRSAWLTGAVSEKSRYEIVDILSQDRDGVVFHAEDRQRGEAVVLRRFFPFGADGGGLEAEERGAYEIAVRRLKKLEHPALREVLDGGTDAVDGMPFLVTAWAAGRPLAERLAERPLSPSSTRALVDLAIEVSLCLSAVFHEEAVWIETESESIYLDHEDPEHPISFRISPLRWLGQAEQRRGLQPLLDMVEEVTGWHGRIISDSSGEGLGRWVKELRNQVDDWTLGEAREALAATPVIEPGPASAATIQRPPPIEPPRPIGKAPAVQVKSSPLPWLLTGALVAGVAALGAWVALRPEEPPSLADRGPLESSAEVVRGQPAASDKTSDERLTEPAAAVLREPTFSIGQRHTMIAEVDHVRASRSGKTIYLEFGASNAPGIPCARYHTRHETLDEGQLEKFAGQRIKITGRVVSDPSGRPAIDLTTKAQIETLDD